MPRLKTQQALVALRAHEVLAARAASAAATYRLLQTVGRRISSPAGLATAFTAGFLWGARRGGGGADDAPRPFALRAKRLLVAAGWLAQQVRALQSPQAPLG